MKTEKLLILGGLGIGAYLLLKSGALNNLFEGFTGGGGGYYTQPTYTQELGAEQNLNAGTNTYGQTQGAAPTTGTTGWRGSYGQRGQPSVTFALNTLTQASRSNATPHVRMAAAAIAAHAPPRVVAKIKAGKWG